MPLEPALISYAGLACWALSTQRLRRDLAIRYLPDARAIRVCAALILMLAAARATHYFGPYQGPVAMIGMLSVSGLLLLLLLSRWPRLAISVALAAALLVAASIVMHAGERRQPSESMAQDRDPAIEKAATRLASGAGSVRLHIRHFRAV